MRKLRSLHVWQAAQGLAQAAYTLSSHPKLAKHFALVDQIRRSALSIPANIAEGYALGSTAQFIRCLKISLGSTAELLSHLTLLQTQNLIPESEIAHSLKLCERSLSVTIGLIRKLMSR